MKVTTMKLDEAMNKSLLHIRMALAGFALFSGFAISIPQADAATGTWGAYARLNDGGGDDWYDTSFFNDGPTNLPQLKATSPDHIGLFSGTDTLDLTGAALATFENAGDDVTQGYINYAVYKTSGGTPSFTEISLGTSPTSHPNIETPSGYTTTGGGDEEYRSTSLTTDLLSGLSANDEEYTLQIYWRAATSAGDRFFSDAGNADYKVRFNFDNTAPAAPSTPDLNAGSDTGSSNVDDITNDDTPTFEGTAEANSTVEVFRAGAISLGTTSADGSGNWSFTPGTALSEATHTITATATDAAGNTSTASSGLSITIDKTAPAVPSVPDMTASTDQGSSDTDNVTNDLTPTFTGTSDASVTVNLISSVDGTIATGAATGGGVWTLTPGSAMSVNVHSVTASATDVAGNTSAASSGLSATIVNSGIWGSYVQINNGDGGYWYDTFSATAQIDFDGNDFVPDGQAATTPFKTTDTLVLSGGENNTYKGDVDDDITGNRIFTGCTKTERLRQHLPV